MSRIRMAVRLENRTQEALVLQAADLEHGDWTDPWQPHARIDPGETHEFRAEGSQALDVPTTGTEGFATYAIGGDPARTLRVAFDSPLVESQFGNTFHVEAPTLFDVASSGGQGHHATLDVVLQPSFVHRVPDFVPRVRGLHFPNTWRKDLPVVSVGTLWNKLLDNLPDGLADVLGVVEIEPGLLPMTEADGGLCGGMVFAVMDYYAAHQLPPDRTDTPSSPDDEVFRHVRDRLVDSFDIFGGGHRFLVYSSPVYPDGDEGFVQATGIWEGRSWVTYREEWPKIRADIDAGRLSPLGLIKTDTLAIGDNHQVLAHAYQRSGQKVSLFIYDPNTPDVEVRFDLDVTATTGRVHVDRFQDGRAVTGGESILAIFRTDGYAPHLPPQGRPLDAMSVRDALECRSGSRNGTVPADDSARPLDVRAWMRGF